MEPIGTITSYFSFIDEDTKNVLEKIMLEALDYYDFVHKLGNLVLKNDSPVLIVYFAIHHAILALEYPLIERIREKYQGPLILGPNLYITSVDEGNYENVRKVKELADSVLASEPPNWMALEMHFMKFEADMRNYPTTIYDSSNMEKIRTLIDSNPDFGFYEIILCDYLSIRAHHDGDREGRLECLDRGLEIAKKYDDRLREAHLLIMKSSLYKGKEARAILERAYEIVDTSLGIPANFADIIYKLSILDALRGDFDSAINRSLQSVSIRERAGLESGNASLFLSIMYNVIDEPESGLEWALMAEDQFKSRPYMVNRSSMMQIWSLALLKKFTEAQILLDTTQELVMKSGDDSHLAWLYFATGTLEFERGNYVSASSSFDQALRIYEQFNWGHANQIIFLHHLAKAEVYSCETENLVSPSLAILEEKAIAEDLPGFLGLVHLLKGEIAIMNNDESQLQEIISQVRILIDQEKLHYLNHFLRCLLAKI